MNASAHWTAEKIGEITRGFQQSCVLVAAAELGLFDVLADKPMSADDVATRMKTDNRATAILLDALTAMGLVTKDAESYTAAPGTIEALGAAGPDNVLAITRHHANCLRNWAQLASIVQTGRPGERIPSILGPQADLESFIEAMDNICRSMAPALVERLGPPKFTHLLDLGGGPGTWTIAFLRAVGDAKATLFDRPDVIPIARKHVAAAALEDRVTFAAGDFAADQSLPGGADLAWVSAIVHQNSRQENRDLFAKIYAALTDGGRILIRDVVMDASRTQPADGALFAINMLVHTPGGGTYTFGELSEDLTAAGFVNPEQLIFGEFMESVIQAAKGDTDGVAKGDAAGAVKG